MSKRIFTIAVEATGLDTPGVRYRAAVYFEGRAISAALGYGDTVAAALAALRIADLPEEPE